MKPNKPLREMIGSGKWNERLRAVLSLTSYLPKSFVQELLNQTVNDRSKRVRYWTAWQCDQLTLREMVPVLLQQAEVEPNPEMKREIERHALLLRDGYIVELQENGRLELQIRLPNGGLTWIDISQKDIKSGQVPSIVQKKLAEMPRYMLS